MNAATQPVIETLGLVRDFGRTRALDGLNLSVAAGEIHGFLGPNGAGKSTTLRVLLGLIRPTAGTARVFGKDPWADPVATHRDIAYVPGDVSLWPNLSGGEAIDLLTGLRGGADGKLRRELIEEFEFDPRKKARAYSKGNRQKVALIAAFSRPAGLYLLDEPSAGLDPVMDAVFRRQIQRVTHGISIDGTAAEVDADAAELGAVLAGIAEPGISGLTVAPPSRESLFLRRYSDRNGSEVQ
ncbi:ABC transporter ATP-binding protein [Arthrobacter sp. 24S4-2]|uniref:ABC transporter ATP-binding protein n=1 Tax=Arthrobacter sp. 24S4-2 TaxID=2575374 RepID=UPI0010C7D552|nr:ABC transporter ATP-binding protein [Arthrobacter sp. 24S4-2]QCO98258.1 ABC transporter ATP-binding protein [Arthrobacter sp. 24S4-2]